MQRDLHIGPVGWGWVTGIFAVSYGLFEVTDRRARRSHRAEARADPRPSLWWSAFTALTGAVTGYVPLLLTPVSIRCRRSGRLSERVDRHLALVPARPEGHDVRCLADGEPVRRSARTTSWWCPSRAATAGATSFFVFGALGIVWAGRLGTRGSAIFRREPCTAHDRIRAEVIHFRGVARSARRAHWPSLGTAFCYVYVRTTSFQTWFHTFLVKGRGFSETGLMLSALPYVVAAAANLDRRRGERRAGSEAGPDPGGGERWASPHSASQACSPWRPCFHSSNSSTVIFLTVVLWGDHVPAIRSLRSLPGYR